MTFQPTLPATFDALPNPRGGAVRAAETALADAQRALEAGGDCAGPLLRAAHALREAGWLSAHRFVDTLLLVSPLALAANSDAANLDEGGAHRVASAALGDFRAALARHNLRELSCSPALYGRLHAMCQVLAPHTPGFTISFEDYALVARPVPPATMRPQPAQRIAHMRARYEAALLPALKTQTAGSRAAAAWADAAFNEMDACLAELAGPDPYDFWRLASACGRALRASRHATGEADARRFYARCNLALADQARGVQLAPRSLVRSTLALLWRDYALFGAAAEDADHVELLHDYGLTVDWHVAATQASEALWEEGASQQAGSVAAPRDDNRELGVLTISGQAYEDFLQTADASMTALNEYARTASRPEKADPGAALQAGDAAYRVGAAACALGLGHVALMADALGLAWRRTAYAGVATPAVRSHVVVEAPDVRALEQGCEALRAMLLKTAAGVAPPDSSSALAALARAIEQGGG
ncbi:hypothetical protein [Paraburkholderia sp. SUR17]|uniref:hypothetical protein n=1 Tax=Paraburkholderia sp. SUR17 TaxID=3034358 RepID=UPI0024087BA9|nr:hypothetical protein [Paraburkholderia sp. SUR17]WEY39403.1 hypothetical protein P2869_03235 [Paraburkholderia sp. SUR17]